MWVPSLRRPWTPRLRTVLLLVNGLILLLPLGGISLLRLYDTVLIRQTEAELIAQGAVIAAVFRGELLAAGAGARYGRPRRSTAAPALARGRFRPVLPHLDLARDAVWPPAKAGIEAEADPLAAVAGGRLQEILEEAQQVTLAGLRIVDAGGTVVATSGDEAGRGLHHRREVVSALGGESRSVLRARTSESAPPALGSLSRGTRLRVVVAMPVVHGNRVWGAVVLARTPMAVRQAIYQNRRYFLPGAAVLALVVTLVALLTARTLSRPIDRLIEQTARVRGGQRAAGDPLRHPGTHEVEQISRAVAEMARVLQERADYIATFASNVSHELKTPLTAVRGTVELLRDHLAEMTPAELERFLSMLEKDTARLDRLVTRLLELARADVVRPMVETAEIAPVLKRLVERFHGEGMNIALAVHTRPVRVRMAPEVLASVLANLLDNARQHGGPGVTVKLQARRLGDRLELAVRDDGPGISAAHQPRVFDRFFTTGRERGGSGLGLAIVRSLLKAHGGTVRLRSMPGETEFVVALPLP